MTTLAALATKDAIVMGCDSLGTVTGRLLDPRVLLDFFDPDRDFALKLDEQGKPKLASFTDVYQKAREYPVENMTHMTKLFSLDPLKIGVMITGITSVGNRTVKSLIEEFKSQAGEIETTNYSVQDIARKLSDHISNYYQSEFPDEKDPPYLELILGGYAKGGVIPGIYRIKLPEKEINKQLEPTNFGMVFGGQMKEIQRIVFGTDSGNKEKIKKRHLELLRRYHGKITEELRKTYPAIQIREPSVEELQGDLRFFGNDWDLNRFDARWEDFSEQNAIECVDFFVNIMIKSQQFSRGMPTVGGDVHIAMISEKEGFRSVSREEYCHEDHFIPKLKDKGGA